MALCPPDAVGDHAQGQQPSNALVPEIFEERRVVLAPSTPMGPRTTTRDSPEKAMLRQQLHDIQSAIPLLKQETRREAEDYVHAEGQRFLGAAREFEARARDITAQELAQAQAKHEAQSVAAIDKAERRVERQMGVREEAMLRHAEQALQTQQQTLVQNQQAQMTQRYNELVRDAEGNVMMEKARVREVQNELQKVLQSEQAMKQEMTDQVRYMNQSQTDAKIQMQSEMAQMQLSMQQHSTVTDLKMVITSMENAGCVRSTAVFDSCGSDSMDYKSSTRHPVKATKSTLELGWCLRMTMARSDVFA